jgi:hypothetical protein
VPPGARPRIARTIVHAVDRVNLSAGTRPPVPADLDATLRDRYRDRIERLGTILQRDLSGWTEPQRQSSNA